MVVRRRYLDDVHPGEIDGRHDPSDRPEQLAGHQATWLRRPGSGGEPRIDHVDVDAQVDRIGAVEGLRDRVVDDGISAALLDLAHEVVAQAVLLHPLEDIEGRPVTAKTDLDEVLAEDGARLDEPSHRCSMAREDAPVVVGGVGVGVEVDDPDAAGSADFGNCRRGWPRDRVIAPEDDRDRARSGDLENLAVDECVATLDPGRDDVRVAGVHHRQQLERLDVELERIDRSRRVLRLADGSGAEPCPGSMAHRVVERRPDDRHVHAPCDELQRVRDPGQVHERRRADVGGQLEVAVRLEFAVPAIGRREIALGRGIWVVGALSHEVLRRRTVGASGDRWKRRLAGGAAGSHPASSGARRFAS